MRAFLVRFLHRLNGLYRVLEALKDAEGRVLDRIERLEQFSASASWILRTRLVERHGYLKILTAKPVAADSPDHLAPWGTARDNSTNLRFNARMRAWIPAEQLRVLDLGCSGGGQVKSFLDQGCYAVGVEGSDFSRRTLRAEWATIPEFLFTADITEPFSLVSENSGDEPFLFSVITLWEVIEHLRREKLPALFENIDRHLAPSGVVIMSVSPNSDIVNGVELHQTIENRDWWLRAVSNLGFTHHQDICDHFAGDYVRGHDNALDSFHLILTRNDEEPMFRDRLPRART